MHKLYNVSKKLLGSITGLCVLMLLTATLISSMGSLLSGGLAQWQQALKTATPYLYLWRIIIYAVVASFWYSTLKAYQQKQHQEGINKTKRLGAIALLVVVTVEGSKLLGMINQ